MLDFGGGFTGRMGDGAVEVSLCHSFVPQKGDKNRTNALAERRQRGENVKNRAQEGPESPQERLKAPGTGKSRWSPKA